MPRTLLTDWTVDYGDRPKPVTIPHAWRQEVDVRWEGPAIYRTTLEVPEKPCWLVFHGVSYAAKVFMNDELVAEHHGIWDAFSVPLTTSRQSPLVIRVEVTKNGGATYPVRDVASGFLPFVFNTFGGIYKEVELVESDEDPLNQMPPSPPCRVTVKGTKIFVDGKPFYLRAPLTWGWYPEFGHTNPDVETVRKEVRQMKSMGFNTVKFCLWVPHHRYFEILEELGMFAWLELPLWDPTPNTQHQESMFAELKRIVLEYRRHSNIIVWTCGCELSSNTSAEYRERLYKMVKELTGAALVKDNSGGSEMYGGDLREFGDFYDFHPYCDLPFYPLVLDSLLIGPRKKMPILLGEFNDYDVHRDLARLKRERPFWTSEDPYLNDQGSRWQHDLPRILDEARAGSRWEVPSGLEEEMEWPPPMEFPESYYSERFAADIRRRVHESVRSLEDIAGYVITGWCDTPIASSGMVDDWGREKDGLGFVDWNAPTMLFPIDSRKPPWADGGNRPGWIYPWTRFEGPLFLRFGVHSETGERSRFVWRLERFSVKQKPYLWKVARGKGRRLTVPALEPTPVGEVVIDHLKPGNYILHAEWGSTKSIHKLEVFGSKDFKECAGWSVEDPIGQLEGLKLPGGENVVSTVLSDELVRSVLQGSAAVVLLTQTATKPAPFFREGHYTKFLFDPGELRKYFASDGRTLRSLLDGFHFLLPVSGDRAIDRPALQDSLGKEAVIEDLMIRIDTRTYREDPILIRAKVGKGTLVATTLRPYGGLGIQPVGVMNNPAGAALLESLIKLAEEPE